MPLDLYQQLQPETNCTYKLLQLTPEILKCMENDTKLTIKSPFDGNDLTLASDNQSWKIRQMDQTNTVLLMDNTKKDGCWVGRANFPYEYELSEYKGGIRGDLLPLYGAQGPQSPGSNESKIYISKAQLLDNTPVSEQQFERQWQELGLCEVDGVCYVVSPDVVSKVLTSFLTAVISQNIDYAKDPIDTDATTKLVSQHHRGEIVATVVGKFVGSDGVIDNTAVAKWYGIETLKHSRPMEPNQFYIEWKSKLPQFYHIPLNLDTLRGHFYKSQNRISYLNEQTLSADLAARMKELFKVCREWDLDDIRPYIAVLTARKVESVVLKYAKIKTSGSRKTVYPR